MHAFDALKIGVLGKERDIRLDVALAGRIVGPRQQFQYFEPVGGPKRFTAHA
jgi:hypothetical protein